MRDGSVRLSSVATFTAAVVVPTPPLAPTNAKTLPAAVGVRCDSSLRTAVSSSVADSGSATHSFTPARIASSTTAGSSDDTTSSTGVDGCWRLSMASVEGSGWPPRTSTMTTSG